MGDVERITKQAIADGGVLAMLYFDLHASTKESVQELGAGFVNEIIHKPGVIFALGEIDEPFGGEKGKNWSTSISVKVLTKDFATLAGLCMDHSPFSMEILRPDEIKMPLNEAVDLLSVIAAITAKYKRYILTKVAKPEEVAQMQEDLKRRAELGRKILEKKEEKKKG